MKYELSRYIRAIDVVAGGPVHDWLRYMTAAMRWDMEGLVRSDHGKGDPVRVAYAVKMRDRKVAAMKRLEAENPCLKKIVDILRKPRIAERRRISRILRKYRLNTH